MYESVLKGKEKLQNIKVILEKIFCFAFIGKYIKYFSYRKPGIGRIDYLYKKILTHKIDKRITFSRYVNKSLFLIENLTQFSYLMYFKILFFFSLWIFFYIHFKKDLLFTGNAFQISL